MKKKLAKVEKTLASFFFITATCDESSAFAALVRVELFPPPDEEDFVVFSVSSIVFIFFCVLLESFEVEGALSDDDCF